MKGKGGRGSWPTFTDCLRQTQEWSISVLQAYQEMCVCGGTQPTTASLTSLLQDESEEVVKSIQSCTVGLFFLAGAEKDEAPQQPSQDGDVCASKGVPGLGEGGRASEELRGSSLGQSPVPQSVSRAGCR